MKLIARILIILGLTLIAVGRKLDRPPAAKMVIRPRRHYHYTPPRRPRFNFNWFVFTPAVG